MIYLKHNVHGNFAKGDDIMRSEIVLSEVGKRIAVRPEQVIGFLKQAGVEVSDKAGLNKLVGLVSDGLKENDKLVGLFVADVKGGGEMAEAIKKVFKAPGAKGELMKYTKAINGIAYGADGVGEGTKKTVKVVLVLGLIVGGIFVYNKMN